MKTAKLFIAAVVMVGTSSAFASLPCNAKAVKGGIFGNTTAKIAGAKSSSSDKVVAAASSSEGTVK